MMADSSATRINDVVLQRHCPVPAPWRHSALLTQRAGLFCCVRPAYCGIRTHEHVDAIAAAG
jgi:hypothetical protein